MSAHVIHASRVDPRVLSQEPRHIIRMSPAQRQHIHGRILPMDPPKARGLWARITGRA